MPPKKGIVKTGNAGNSSKAKETPPPIQEGEKPLFPPGSKFPLSLLHERCQKAGWEKPVVDTRRHPDGWSFVVSLSKLDKKTSQRVTVRLEPHPPYLRPTSLEARHWGATYALYRFCNGIQLHRVLPPGPRDYWNELAAEHKNVPAHMVWMYEADPFVARQQVDERQAKAAKQRENESTSGSSQKAASSGKASGKFSKVPEVRMASSLRELVDDAIKKGFSLYPEAADASPSALSEEDATQVARELGILGFTPAQVRNGITFLSQQSPFATSLLGSLSLLETAIEFLILSVPECDLPQRFLPSVNSSNPFITSAHSGTDDLKKRWLEDKAVKEAGWPAHIVKDVTSNPDLLNDWDALMVTLGQKLIGEEWVSNSLDSIAEPYNIDDDEIEALGAHYADPSHLIMPLFSAPIQVHILKSVDKGFPRHGYIPMYVTSPSVPAYIRLHLLSQVLLAMKSEAFVEADEGFCMAIMRFLEGEWAKIEDNGPPEMSNVLKHISPRPKYPPTTAIPMDINEPNISATPRRRRPMHRDERNDHQIKHDFEISRQNDKYTEILNMRQKLPAFGAMDSFLQKLEHNRVVVVVGETGCGKTTQLPQFVLDSLILSGNGSKASILVTQPRRISAISVAARVSSERLGDGSVGYAIRGESKQDKRTKILFCTTGVVLRRLGSGDMLQGISHVIVDEVHERSVDGDFLLLELKELLRKHSNLKVILMSATINHDTFVRYFDGAPLLTIPGFTHPVADKYLEDVIPLIHYRTLSPQRSNRKEDRSMREAFWAEYQSQGLEDSDITTLYDITRSDRIDFQLVATVVNHIISTNNKRGGILIFLPGAQEIRQCISAVRTILAGEETDILPLHANLSSDEQQRVFAKTSKWKIIAATNVAETSITIDDVVYVIDAGKVKENQYDPDTSLSRLEEAWVTQAAARQRRGRAGRTQPGVCFKLYTRKQETNMARFPVPEILRVPLESISLTVKVMREEEDVKTFLSRAIDPPKIVAMERAWSILEELGAVDEAGKLTALGRHISTLPVDLRLAKMLILGTIFQCLGPVLTIAASLSSKPLFLSPMDQRDAATQARARFATAGSDLLTDLKAYDECARLQSEGKSQSAIRSFCEENFISTHTIREVTALRQEFFSTLSDMGFIPFSYNPSTPALNTNSDNVNLLKAVIVGGLWPRVARIHLPESAIKFDKVQAGTVQRQNTAREFKIFDLTEGRVFLHPGSVLFGEAAWKAPFVTYFHKYKSSRVFLRDATELPLYALLLFGGTVSVNQVRRSVTIRSKDSWITLEAWPRIGVLVNHLRRLLDAQLERCVEEGTLLSSTTENPVLNAILLLLTHDGLSDQ